MSKYVLEIVPDVKRARFFRTGAPRRHSRAVKEEKEKRKNVAKRFISQEKTQTSTKELEAKQNKPRNKEKSKKNSDLTRLWARGPANF